MSGFPVEISICQRAALSANWSRGEAKICGKEKNKKRLRQSSEGEKNWLRRYPHIVIVIVVAYKNRQYCSKAM